MSWTAPLRISAVRRCPWLSGRPTDPHRPTGVTPKPRGVRIPSAPPERSYSNRWQKNARRARVGPVLSYLGLPRPRSHFGVSMYSFRNWCRRGFIALGCSRRGTAGGFGDEVNRIEEHACTGDGEPSARLRRLIRQALRGTARCGAATAQMPGGGLIRQVSGSDDQQMLSIIVPRARWRRRDGLCVEHLV